MPIEPPVGPVPPGVRAQILATEHWSLLATRSTAQAEVLSRISILLTFVSATTVRIALVGQATDFDGRTYNFFLANPVSHLFGRTGMLVGVGNSAVAGILAAVVAGAAGAGTGLIVTCGVVVAVAYFLVAGSFPARRYLRLQRDYRPMFPTPPSTETPSEG
jgi:hypothetical protein